ncbi:acetyl-CoA carboxylase, carboxyltransferase subunit beta [Paenibacillus sp. YIM B09110]|uniref:acetyl-CoA carboxylase, carboxyltransferase subunit beta n=1 Tax=Paenibacillus sp. YIM B09110 TaxID=3126102 RepID=UPI00301CA210
MQVLQDEVSIISFRDFITNKKKYAVVSQRQEINVKRETENVIPNGLMKKCPKCNAILYSKELEKNLNVCSSCNYHFRLTARERISFFLDDGILCEFSGGLTSDDPLHFVGYKEKLNKAKQSSGLNDAIITGEGKLGDFPVIVALLSYDFFTGTMGAVVGEKIVRAVNRAMILKLPLIIFSTSGGARMQESIFSLMQMAKTSAAIGRFSDSGGLYISIITDQTFGGVSASFGMLGDYIFAEAGATFGFAGRIVIEQVIRQKLPPDFQSAEFYLDHGQIDGVINRKNLRKTIIDIIDLHTNSNDTTNL